MREVDCFETRGEPVRGIKVQEIVADGQSVESFEDRIRGRVAAEDVVHPETGEVLVRVNGWIDHDTARDLVKAGITEMSVRSVLTCRNEHGVCARCYGANMAHGGLVDVGEAVGIIAAQSIAASTQLTMRTFHTGGVAGGPHPGLPVETLRARSPR